MNLSEKFTQGGNKKIPNKFIEVEIIKKNGHLLPRLKKYFLSINRGYRTDLKFDAHGKYSQRRCIQVEIVPERLQRWIRI